jgi:hypothetical protein
LGTDVKKLKLMGWPVIIFEYYCIYFSYACQYLKCLLAGTTKHSDIIIKKN